MTPAAIIQKAATEGVRLTLSPAGTIKATGNTEAVNRWLPIIREHKPAIVEVLQETADSPSTHYTITTDTTADPEDVIMALTIRNKATCQIRIPKSRYDAFTLLELIEKHTIEKTLQ